MLLRASFILALFVSSLHAAGPEKAPQPERTADGRVWAPAPQSMPKGTKISLETGHPQRPGPFSFLLKLPAGAQIKPHIHPSEERIDVLSGSLLLGTGPVLDRAKTVLLSPGESRVNPPGSPHFLLADRDAVIRISGRGPWQTLPPKK